MENHTCTWVLVTEINTANYMTCTPVHGNNFIYLGKPLKSLFAVFDLPLAEHLQYLAYPNNHSFTTVNTVSASYDIFNVSMSILKYGK